MRDITENVLKIKKVPKNKTSFTKKLLPKFGITFLLGLGALGIFLVASASATTWTGNGTTNGFCSDVSSDNTVPAGEQRWLFILTSPGTGPWSLTTSFSPSFQDPIGAISGIQQGNGSIHFTVFTNIGAQLLSASATNGTDNSVLTVSHCETGLGTSATSTTLHDANHNVVTEGSSVALGSIIHDLATVTLTPSAIPTGSVTFRFYTTVAACTADTNFTGGVTEGTVALDGNNPGVAHPSQDTGALTPGTYAFKANWPGNTSYQGSTSDCENFTVNQAQLAIATRVHSDSPDQGLVGNLSLGSGAHDAAKIKGQVGNFTLPDVTFYFFAKGVACTDGDTTGGTQLNTVSPDGTGFAHPSTSETALAAGTYNFMAVVAGNNNYLGATSNCEPFTVNQSQLAMESKVHDSAHVDKTNGSVPLGSIMHDTAKITSGVVGGFTPPAITFKFYTNGTCDGGGTSVTNTGADQGDVTRDRSAASIALAAGSYSYKAFVASDANYLGTDSGCEPFTVNQAQLTVTTDIHNANHQIVTSVVAGSIVHDTASVAGGVNGFTVPAVTFTFYTNSTCDGQGTAVTNTGADEGNASLVRSANSAALVAGSYAYKASVAGNTNYLGDESDCEPLTVTNPFWCSPGFWATALSKNRTGVLNYLLVNAGGLDLTTAHYNDIPSNLKAPLSKKATITNPTLAQVLASPNIYGGPAFNSVADYISLRLGWGGTQNTGENCPLDAHGNFTGPTLTLTI
ncbi:MAG TPA: Ig-like domain-containing protein [Candidatus Saccharimonadales bacterium]|nr:Ig-like domain-containing protein [Candidatus Saccharimonadales bacterium]